MTALLPEIDGTTFRRVLGHYPTGVCLIAAIEPDAGPAGLIVGSFTSVSLDPPLVAFFPDRRSTTWPRIERAGRFCVNVLSQGQEALSRRFAGRGSRKFEGIDYALSRAGSPVLAGAVAWIDCTLHAVHEAGDHYIALGRVLELDIVSDAAPLLFLRGQYTSPAPLV